ncbi:hypothetical protein GPJ56_004168 [Histomonas meleagridis]|uniref:uncharacterized protein n=1 Tax=Histomonas meleagridis TaxID=135588 RepID=UPI00355A805F|nr:hypothetical protein GPJ56_004168 [Histomonas meleagridis]KAH0801509.1 hypothetical protein GO595_005761 [Histomonas meleagridis]
MKEFAIKWKSSDTEELLMLLPRYALTEPMFSSTETIAKGSNLTQKFSLTVVLLRALLLHHFNFIRTNHYKTVPQFLWDSMTSFISCEESADIISKSIICGKDKTFPYLTIDRYSARKLILDGNGNSNKSIIAQLTKEFKTINSNQLQCRKRPWSVTFMNEHAIDVGGPARELMTEVADSIFEPTSQLCYKVPNGRKSQGNYQDTYIPYDKLNQHTDEYITIGIYLGIVIRTGLVQDLPFAPIVWKYLAKEKINDNDILCLDDAMNEMFKHLREDINNNRFEENIYPWKIENWDGQITVLPGHSYNSFVRMNEVEQYIQESIQYRIQTLKPTLKLIRNAFRTNIGFKSHPLLNGNLLSRMAQGSSIITIEHLKSITIVSDYDGINDPYIVRFWKAVERLTPEQRKLLLKFITTLTRLPNTTINQDFTMQIDKLAVSNPDETLPTAATCFNRLHLPPYSDDQICYEKLLYAIQFCQTMENK